MNHLTDEQIVAMFYSESACEQAEVNDHLQGCSQCRERLEQLSEVGSALDSITSPTDKIAIDVARIVEQEMVLNAGQVVAMEQRGPFRSWVAVGVTAALLAAGGFGFLAGVSYQTQHSFAAIKAQVESVLKQTPLPENTNSHELGIDIAQQFKQQFDSLNGLLDSRDKELANQNLAAMKEMDARFRQLLVEQTALREDLQTLAVNAENEISITREDVRQIGEYIANLLPISQ